MPNGIATSSTRTRRTALFIALTLGGAYAVGALWITHPKGGWLSQYLMWMPGLAALVVQALDGEPPRAMGFRFTGAAPWLLAIVYPLGVISVCIGCGYALRALIGGDVIHY